MDEGDKVYAFEHTDEKIEVFEDGVPMLTITFKGRYVEGSDLFKLMVLKLLFQNVIEAHEKGETYTDAEIAAKRGLVH